MSDHDQKESTPEVGSWKVAMIVTFFGAGLLIVGALRYFDLHSEDPPAVAAYATLIYIGLAVFAAIGLIRAGVPFRRLGFTLPVRPWSVIALALLGVAVLQLSGWLLTPVWEQLFGSGRDLTRFSDVAGSPAALVQILALSWTVVIAHGLNNTIGIMKLYAA